MDEKDEKVIKNRFSQARRSYGGVCGSSGLAGWPSQLSARGKTQGNRVIWRTEKQVNQAAG
jgi:hypothetical protein